MDCIVCCEVINGHNKPIECCFCDFTACTRCTERYLLNIHDDAHCMSCRKGWDTGVLNKCMTNTFLSTKFRQHRKDTLLDREKSLLPQTQPDVARCIADRERKALIDNLTERKKLIRLEVVEIDKNIRDIQRSGNIVRETGLDGGRMTRKCPIENCRGFLAGNWMCGICETQICKECNEEKGDEHVCDQNNVETMKLLKKDSKPCPSCGTIITKIDGCDQMWCTQPSCHAAFSWRTGQKVFGIIHNPHFIQFSMENGTNDRNPMDLPCGGLPNIVDYFNNVRRYSEAVSKLPGKDFTNPFTLPIRCMRHIMVEELNHYNVTDVRDLNADLRVRYLMNEITDNGMASTVINRDTARAKKKAFHDIVVMTLHTGTDITNVLNALISDRGKPYSVTAIDDQLLTMKKLRQYANSQFKRVGDLYKCKYPRIDMSWEFIRFWPIASKVNA
jgi:hypothetical protein